ncbi:hypothetical protein AC578_9101 [Pseudocercospora eumusae]|uniref:NmrA-like domain-containing protein n=1 Tax=Pseudocercospora eumusae TaxID=321146 RepID=A0A139HVA5_9PEZI|nr:hypothetical protein AC578_9101 [Pseudocercospora eumusae]
MHPDELTVGMIFIEAAIQFHRAGLLKYLVFAGVVHAQLTSLINHKNKLEMEDVMIESGMPYTIMPPTLFMGNISMGYLQQQAKEIVVFDAIFKPDAKISFRVYPMSARQFPTSSLTREIWLWSPRNRLYVQAAFLH